VEKNELIAVLEKSLNRQLDWVKSADTKAAFSFAMNTAMLGVLAAMAPKHAASWTTLQAVFASFAAFFGFISLASLSVAAYPRTQGPKQSLIFSAGIAQRSTDQFKQAMVVLDEDAYITDLAEQCHRNAEIAITKFSWVQRAVFCMYVAVVPWAVALWLLYNSVAQ
jgi:hypothetical protein